MLRLDWVLLGIVGHSGLYGLSVNRKKDFFLNSRAQQFLGCHLLTCRGKGTLENFSWLDLNMGALNAILAVSWGSKDYRKKTLTFYSRFLFS